jgi:hypothetical protein
VEAIGFFFVLFWYAIDPSTHTFKLQRITLKNSVKCNRFVHVRRYLFCFLPILFCVCLYYPFL